MWILFGIIYLLIGVLVIAVGLVAMKCMLEDDGYEIKEMHFKPFKMALRIIFWPAYLIRGSALSKVIDESGETTTEYIFRNCQLTKLEEDEP